MQICRDSPQLFRSHKSGVTQSVKHPPAPVASTKSSRQSLKTRQSSPGGQMLGLQVVIQDITERKQAERALNQSNVSLRRGNEDLEQFAFSASHDLQEPVRRCHL